MALATLVAASGFLVGGGAQAHAAECPSGDCNQEAAVWVDNQVQQTGYWCGPAATRVALSARGFQYEQGDLANMLGTTVDGTASIDNVTQVLDNLEHTTYYQSKWIPGEYASDAATEQLRSDIQYDIQRDYPLVINVVGSATDTSGGYHSYSGGHYMAVSAFKDYGNLALVDDVANGSFYWMDTKSLADWIAGRGYSA